MITTDETTNLITEDEPNQKWAEPFADLLDEIYFPGFAKNLVEEDPEVYNREYFHFIQLYDSP